MNHWIASLIALAAVVSSTSDVSAFAPPQVVSTPKQLRQRSQLTLPYQLCPECDTTAKEQLRPYDLPPKYGNLPFATTSGPLPVTSSSVIIPAAPGLRSVTISLLPSDANDGTNKPYPLLITPRADSSLDFLSRFLKQNKEWIDEQMIEYGAVLFRGFDVNSAQDVQDALTSYTKLNNNYRGTSPRNTQGGTDFVFSAAEVPSTYPIAQHLEMSFLPSPPRKLFFSALQAPQTPGGETALADFRKVYRDLPMKLRNKLAEKKIKYRRTHRKVGAKFTQDVASMQGWPEVFGTSDKAEVESIAREEGMPLQWEGRNKDVFVSETMSEPFQLHPQTKEPVWFNHAQVFHWTTFPAELFLAFRRTRDLRFLFRAASLGLLSVIMYGILGRKMALESSFGDGTPINMLEMHQIRKAIHKNMVFNRWQKGDILMIDNFSTSHGRQPTYGKGRKIVVAWSDPSKKSNEMLTPSVLPNEESAWE